MKNYFFFLKKCLEKYLTLISLIALFLSLNSHRLLIAQSVPDCKLPQFGRISVDPDLELNGSGQNIDSIEFWKAPDSTQTLMFITAKANHLVEVWKYPFAGFEQIPLTHSTFNNSQANGIAIDQDTDLLYIAVGSPSSTISVFSLPDLTFISNFNSSGADYKSEPNLTILKLTDGTKYIYVSKDYPVDIHNEVTGQFLSEFTPEKGLETMAADNYYQRIYIPDENGRTGVYVYNPDGSVYTDKGSNIFGGSGIFNSDAEGIIVYMCPLNYHSDNGEGFIVVSDQRSDKSDFEFFDRVTWEHLGTLNITGVSNTDGIASYPYPLPDYPLGIFAAQNNDATVVLVGWGKIFNEILSATQVEDISRKTKDYKLYQNYPNPFNPSTTIKYSLPESGNVKLTLFNILGQEIKTLVNGFKEYGVYTVEFNASELNSGIYIYKIESGSFVQTRKMTLLK